MQNFIINGVTFPSECYGKPLRKWDKEHQLLIEAIEKVISDSVISDKGGI